jgi:hypothetical protein
MSYVLWTQQLCGWNEVAFEDWIDLDVFRGEAHGNLFPWSLRVVESAGNSTSNHTKRDGIAGGGSTCPSKFNKLGAFALVNVMVFLISAFLCRRTVIKRISLNLLGKAGSPWWFGIGLMSALLNILSNVGSAMLVHSTPGFKHVPIFPLALLWCSRPRISWAAVLLVRLEKEKSMYFSAGASALAAEIVLQCFGAVYLFRTVNFAARNGFYSDGSIVRQVDGGKSAMVMYGGALLWAVTVGATMIQIIWSFLGVGDLARRLIRKLRILPARMRNSFVVRTRHRAVVRIAPHVPKLHLLLATMVNKIGLSRLVARLEATQQVNNSAGPNGGQNSAQEEISWTEALHNMGLSPERLNRIQKVAIWMALPFLGQWMFWIGFVNFMGDE